MQQPLNSELILSKEQLYDMFQQILGVKKFEHQLLFNALQVSDPSSCTRRYHLFLLDIHTGFVERILFLSEYPGKPGTPRSIRLSG